MNDVTIIPNTPVAQRGRPSRFVTVGDIRKLISSLDDDTPVLYEEDIDEVGKITQKLEQVAVKRARIDILSIIDGDIPYFDNDQEGSTPILIFCAHDDKLQEYSSQCIGPGTFLSTPMKLVNPSD